MKQQKGGRPFSFSRRGTSVARMVTLLMAIFWAGFVLYLGSVSRLPRVPLASEEAEASLGHFGTHLVLGALLYMLFSPAVESGKRRLSAAALAVGVTMVLGISIELIQVFVPERTPESADVGYDALGALTGVLALLVPDQLKVSRKLLFVVANAGAVLAVVFVAVVITVQALGLLRVERCRWSWLSYPLPCISLDSRHEERQATTAFAVPAPEGRHASLRKASAPSSKAGPDRRGLMGVQ